VLRILYLRQGYVELDGKRKTAVPRLAGG
jgi:hypothetical protein